jgi:hypothetical protein
MRMKLAASLFLLLLVRAHGLEGDDDPLGRPLSMFRDGPYALYGYTMFAALALVGLLYTTALVRCRREAEAALSGLALLLLLAVAVTPSSGAFHGLYSFLLLGLLFSHYALLLYRWGGPWFLAHLAAPVALLLATRLHSYGAWQKALILYFLAAAIVHHHILSWHADRATRRSARTSSGARGQPLGRRKVYQLEPGRAWARRRVPRTAPLTEPVSRPARR